MKKTYYIEIDQCNWVVAVVKVTAETKKEAKAKAMKALLARYDLFVIDSERASGLMGANEIDFILDENGNETDVDEDEEE